MIAESREKFLQVIREESPGENIQADALERYKLSHIIRYGCTLSAQAAQLGRVDVTSHDKVRLVSIVYGEDMFGLIDTRMNTNTRNAQNGENGYWENVHYHYHGSPVWRCRGAMLNSCKMLKPYVEAAFCSVSPRLQQQRSFIFGKKWRQTFGDYPEVLPGRISPKLNVPEGIHTPEYAATGVPFGPDDLPPILSEDDIAHMRRAGSLARKVLNFAGGLIKPGVTTDYIDQQVHSKIIKEGAYPSPLNYMGFPKSICTSVNNVKVHGIPDDRALCDGDIVNVDITVYLNGFHGDTSKTFAVGNVDEKGMKLMQVCLECLDEAVGVVKHGTSTRVIGETISRIASKHGFSICRDFAGHGIGRKFHTEPFIFHHANKIDFTLEEGMAFTIEPILMEGTAGTVLLKDGWTAVTEDRGRAAQFEHTLLVLKDGCEILTSD
eukprot:Nk52_evm17s252 gene=Nk52_evmTU17s252